MRNTETENKLDHLKLSFTKPEIAMEIAATFALIAAIVVVALYYQQLPDQIPTHFGFNGEVDGYGGKNSIFLFLGIQIFVYLLLTISLFFPRFYNMPVEITVENAEKQYRLARRMLLMMNVIICWMFFYLQNQTFAVACGQGEGLGIGIWLFMGALLGSIVYMFVMSRRMR